MIKMPDKGRRTAQSLEWAPDDIDALSWGADDLNGITNFVGTYAFIAAEQTVDELYEALGLEDSRLTAEQSAKVGQIADRVVAGMLDVAERARDPRADAGKPHRQASGRLSDSGFDLCGLATAGPDGPDDRMPIARLVLEYLHAVLSLPVATGRSDCRQPISFVEW